MKTIKFIVLIGAFLFVCANAAFGEEFKSINFNPSNQYVSLTDNGLLLYNVKDQTGFENLRVSTDDVDRSTIHAWLGMIMVARAMEKTLTVVYIAETGKIHHIYAPK